MIVPGSVISHEMPGSSHPMLLSQSAQALLGFRKDVRDGTIKMKDYDDQDLEVVRQQRTGLFMIRMDHIHYDRCEELWQTIREEWHADQRILGDSTEEVETSTPENDVEVEASTHDHEDVDCTANVVHPDANRWEKYDLTRTVVIVSAGLMNFEDSEYSNGASHDFTKFRKNKFGDRKPYSGFLTDNQQGAGIAKSSFRSCFPELCEGRQVIFLDCTLVKADPGDDGELRGHTGRHWRNVEKFVDHPSFEELNGGLKEIDPEANILIVCFCNQGRHRSVAEKEVLYDLFKRKWFGSRRGNVTQIDLQRKQWKRLCAPDCVDCDCKSRAFKDAINEG